jgi:hypothetical protein
MDSDQDQAISAWMKAQNEQNGISHMNNLAHVEGYYSEG